MAKFARRHRALTTGLVAATLLLMAGTAVATTQYLEQAALVERRADEAETAERAIAFLEDILDQADPFSGEELSVREVARLAAERIEGQFVERPFVRARLLAMLGTTLKNLGTSEDALPLLEEAVALREAHLGSESPELAADLAARGRVRHNVRDLGGAVDDQSRAIALLRAAGPSKLLSETLSELASTRMDLGELDEARALQEEALRMRIELTGEDDPETFSIRHNIAVRLQFEGEWAGSERALRALLEDLPADSGTRPASLEFLAYSLRMQGRTQEAEGLLREALRLAERRYGRESELTRMILGTLGNVLSDLGRVDEAVAIQREVRDIVHRHSGADSMEGVVATHDLAFAAHDLPDKREAEALYREALEGFRRLGPSGAGLVHQAEHNLSMLYWAQGDLDRAEELERAALEGRIDLFGEADVTTLTSWSGLGDILVAQARTEEALEVRRRSVALNDETFGAATVPAQRARLKLADVLIDDGAYTEAEEVLRRAEASLADMPDPLDYGERVASRLERTRAAREAAQAFDVRGASER